jgi:2-polyprenyl-3-methyl-5-hydroxy-6-metoxy-1,4-benzoquinol methylase
MTCRVCDGQKLQLVIDLGSQPWCNHFLSKDELGKEDFYPLRVVYCDDCSTAQLDYTVKKEIMFSDHTYLSGVTKSLSSHFKSIADEVQHRFNRKGEAKSILDIGSNDGTQLIHFQKLGWDVLGVESSKTTAKIATDAGIPTLNQFFSKKTVKSLGKKFDVINAAGVFFHLEELHSVTEGIKIGLQNDGVFVVQFLYMKSIMENDAFDQIYHEHLLYYTLKTLQILLNRHGLELFDAYLAPIHGGQMIGFVGHPGQHQKTTRLIELEKEEDSSGCNLIEEYRLFQDRILSMKEKNINYLTEAKAGGKKVFGMGAPVKGNTLLNYFNVGPDLIECLLEKNRLRKNLYSPGMHIPILMEDEMEIKPDIYYVLAWNFKKEILANNQHLVDAGIDFYFPINPKISA